MTSYLTLLCSAAPSDRLPAVSTKKIWSNRRPQLPQSRPQSQTRSQPERAESSIREDSRHFPGDPLRAIPLRTLAET
ncbi:MULTISPECIES: hypothetical protein [unclassified Variovorax]|uniref:hypothetical protein n=1 Tax=unclassified Variovorax TaxID=663243 RepID=UPI00177CCC0B|nr:hypothetical protein [Variovorax sp. VRV01]MBD9663402.1 hypothetical protein [Variovorax sp. VRV01]